MKNGALEGYKGNPNHKLWSENGFLNLGDEGNRIFLEWLGELVKNDA